MRFGNDRFVSLNGEELISCYDTDPNSAHYLVTLAAQNIARILGCHFREIFIDYEDDEDLDFDDDFGMILNSVLTKLTT